MGAKPNRKSRHGLHKRKPRFPAGTIFPRGRLVMDFETYSRRDLPDAVAYAALAFSAPTGRKPSEPEIQRIRLSDISFVCEEIPPTDFSEAELRIAASAVNEKIEETLKAAMLGIDWAKPGSDRTAYTVFDTARYRKD